MDREESPNDASPPRTPRPPRNAKAECSICSNLDIRILRKSRWRHHGLTLGERKWTFNVLASDLESQIATCKYCAFLCDALREYEDDSDLDDWKMQDEDERWVGITGKDSGILELSCDKLNLQLYTRGISTPWHTTGKLGYIHEDPLSNQSIQVLLTWIQECTGQHPRCAMTSPARLPSRVINVGPANGSKQPFLYNSRGETRQYATLSYCWGDVQPMTTTRATLRQREAGIDFWELPKTFQDAIFTTRRLGLTYLWIDALCIVQDDKNDWQKESAKIAAIYHGSHITISATTAPDCASGFLSLRDNEDDAELQFVGDNGVQQSVFARKYVHEHHVPFNKPPSTYDEPEPDQDDFPVLKRAWCWSERRLATRVLHFLEDEMIFECATSSRCECMALDERANGVKRDFATMAEHNDQPYAKDMWKKLITEYTQAGMTLPKDALPALSGIAKLMRAPLMGNYFAGLWTGHLHELLLWQSAPGQDCHRAMHYQAPTFSWASRIGPVTYIPWDTTQKMCFVSFLEASAVLKTADPDGEVSNGWIRVKGRLTPAMLNCYYDHANNLTCLIEAKEGITQFEPDAVEDVDGETGKIVYCLPIVSNPPKYAGGDVGRIWTLVLRQAKKVPNAFKRIGITSGIYMRNLDRDSAHLYA
ncbi:HET-domain-containing protein [Glonium stellatum]|uniref:HET-domain-containing protein n=1 Tax=Glonium stellatum TaxID=574774 RepID=A0A8E2JQX9_9PEZI|nr:HET-domain-containing protein [Glonium stellatum]